MVDAGSKVQFSGLSKNSGNAVLNVTVEKQSITNFLSQQKITSELAELQVYLEDSLSVQKLN